MAVNNSLAKRSAQATQITEYESNGVTVKLSPSIIRQYLVSGDASTVTDQEIMMFLALCRGQKLNPFLKEAYLIKYGTQAATIVTGKETFLKRANRNPAFAGSEAGIIVMDKENGQTSERAGTFYLPIEEDVVGGWAKVYIKGRDVPEYTSVSFDEYAGRKKDGSLNTQWAAKPATMIRKVALVQALREAFPEEYAGMLSPEEVAAGNIVFEDTQPDIQMPDAQPAPVEPDVIDADPMPAAGQQTVEDAFFSK